MSGRWQTVGTGRHRWAPHLERVELAQGQVLYESGRASTHVVFPTTAIVSVLYLTQGGASAEVAVVGNDGMVGISLFMGNEGMPNRAVVQRAGQGRAGQGRAIDCARRQ